MKNTYHRFTNSDTPMSDWGHAMFAANRLKVENYGQNEYTLDYDKAVNIYDLEELIKSTWESCQEEQNFGQLDDTDFWMEYSADAVFNSFCPSDIVDSADGYDHELVTWLWDFVLEPNNIMAVSTPDGAVCFDQSLIKQI
ncbi:hypothetical protein ACH6EH_06770 [Paenibacillus sp. JSM ZJ436]|uniref:hypothetical protein n=1 Tax=Paenibacillus sp. JSM ZJ436 TaxID=3376190 RepID=UPI0037AA2187